MARTIEQGVKAYFAGLMGSYNDDDGTENAPKFHVENQLNALIERSLSINLSPSTNAVLNTTKRHVFEARWPVEVVEINYVPDAALNVNATNYAVLSVFKGAGNAAAATSLATKNTSANVTGAANWVAGTPVAFTLTTTTANRKLATGETLAAQILKYGTGGVAVPQGALVVHYRLQ
jgi:hypothetical protein